MALQAIVAETHALDRLTLQAMAGLVGDDGVVVAGLPGSRTRIICAGTEATAARRRRSGVARPNPVYTMAFCIYICIYSRKLVPTLLGSPNFYRSVSFRVLQKCHLEVSLLPKCCSYVA